MNHQPVAFAFVLTTSWSEPEAQAKLIIITTSWLCTQEPDSSY